MLTRQLGQTNEEITAIGLGAMPLTMSGCPDPETSRQVVRCYVEGGGHFIDTANVYTESPDGVGENERLLAAALSDMTINTDAVRIATKGGLRRTREGWEVDAGPAWLRQSCEQSLAALGTEQIFLYQLHAPDPDVDIQESVGALEELRQAGKIRYIGLCNVSLEHIRKAQTVTTITSVQNALHPRRKKSLQNGVLDYCGQVGISFIAHSPVGGYHHYRQLAGDEALAVLAQTHATTPACLSLAWLMHLGPHVIAIPGARRCATVEASFSSLSIRLSTDDVNRISGLDNW